MKYSHLITAKKVVKQLIIALLAIMSAGLLKVYPQVANFSVLGGMTVYGLLCYLTDYLKHRWGLKI